MARAAGQRGPRQSTPVPTANSALTGAGLAGGVARPAFHLLRIEVGALFAVQNAAALRESVEKEGRGGGGGKAGFSYIRSVV